MHSLARVKPKGSPPASNGPKYANVFGQWLVDMAEQDPKLMGITPAMAEGSDLLAFSKRFVVPGLKLHCEGGLYLGLAPSETVPLTSLTCSVDAFAYGGVRFGGGSFVGEVYWVFDDNDEEARQEGFHYGGFTLRGTLDVAVAGAVTSTSLR